MSVQRFVTLKKAKGEIRSTKFEGRDYIVVPVVALVEGVLHAMNSPNPERVLAEEFSMAPAGWNGRPVMPDHPIRNGSPVSANDPEVLESESIGLVFNAHVKGKRLLMEAWIDVERAKKTEKGLALLERLETDEMLEVSVGVFIISEEGEGTLNGVRYNGTWRNIVPDHLALLSEGSTGACSNDMGCGAPRVAVKNLLTKEVITIIMENSAKEVQQQSLKERLSQMLKTMLGTASADVGDGEVRSKLWDALYSVEPAFLGIDEVFSAENSVIYACAPSGEPVHLYRRSFSVADDGSVTLTGDREEVQAVRRYEPIAAGAKPCGCHQLSGKEVSNMTKEQRIAALLASKKNAFTKDVHGAFLESLTEDQLKSIEEAEAKVADPAETPASAIVPAPVVKPVSATAPVKEAKDRTLDEHLAEMHPAIRQQVQRGLAAEKKQKDAVIARIKASKRNPFDDVSLASKSLEELSQLATLAGIEAVASDELTSFEGRGASRPVSTSVADDKPEPAASMSEQVKARAQ